MVYGMKLLGEKMIYIRTDMNSTIATGHMMRCLAIADAIKERGGQVCFLIADDNAVPLLKKRGYEYIIVLGTDWKDMESELSQLEGLIRERSISTILVDSYQVTPQYLSWLQKRSRIVYIDDVNAFFYPVDGLICYANYWKKFHYKERYIKTELCVGMDYVPLRKAFEGCAPKQIKDQIEKILVLSGGSDPYDMIRRTVRTISAEIDAELDVICGAYYPDYEAICMEYRQQEKIHFYRAVDHIETYMKDADIAISAGGTTLYELCACGTPTISYLVADNQLDNVRQFEEDGLIPYAGDAREALVEEQIVSILRQYAKDKTWREECSRRMQQMVDGNGAGRIAAWLLTK